MSVNNEKLTLSVLVNFRTKIKMFGLISGGGWGSWLSVTKTEPILFSKENIKSYYQFFFNIKRSQDMFIFTVIFMLSVSHPAAWLTKIHLLLLI